MLLVFMLSLVTVFLFTFLIIFTSRLAHAAKSRIRTKNGIQEGIYVDIGGIPQYVQIRGADKDNPVILWLHGGPGFPSTYVTYHYQTALEKRYTVACWEQRGCGRTYYSSKGAPPTPEQLLSDTREMVEYLKGRFRKERIVIIGQSWGSVLGMEYIHRHPQDVSAYIGIGQVTNLMEERSHAARCAAERASANGNAEDAAELEERIERFLESRDMRTLDGTNLGRMAELTEKYTECDPFSLTKQIWMGLSSPDMSWNDFRWYRTARDPAKLTMLQMPLVEHLYFGFRIDELGRDYTFPVGFVQGSGDHITPTDTVSEYCIGISAPKKKVMVIQGAGHLPYAERPKEFCDAVLSFLDDM